MAERSNISWTHHTQNFWMGCDKVAPECAHCYIDRAMIKLGRDPWGSIYKTSEGLWKNPFKWEKKAAVRGKALRIFTCSESDFFHDKADVWRDEAWATIRATPHLIYQILTKRPGRIVSHLPADWGTGYPNCSLGVTAGCKSSLRLMDVLRNVPSVVRFVSAEPLLEDISDEINLDGFHWLIAGGESGSGPEYVWPGTRWQDEQENGRRTMKLEWAMRLLEKCRSSQTVFYFKQVTAFRSGENAAALGDIHHNYPSGPYSWYTEDELDADFRKPGKIVVAESETQEEAMESSDLTDNVAEIVSGLSEPGQMESEALAIFVRDGLKKFSKLVPYVRELKARFAALPRGKADIMGCRTWKEFCETVLDHTPSAVRKALAQENKPAKNPQILLPALLRLKKIIPTGALDHDVHKHVRFMATDDGRVLLSAGDVGMQLHITLDVPAPKPEFLGLGITGPEDEKLFLQIMDLVERGCPGMQPWGFLVRFAKLLDTCEGLDGDPCITYRGPNQPLEIEESSDGRLMFQYLPLVEDFKALFPYTGNFLPDLNSGDEVFVRRGAHIGIETVKQITAAKIVTSGGTFDREGQTSDGMVVKLPTDEDRQLVAVQQAKEQNDQEAEQLVKAMAEAEKENANRDNRRRHEVLLQSANTLLSRIPQIVYRHVNVLGINQPEKLALTLHVSVEQLEQIVVALKPDQIFQPISDDGPDSPDDLDPENAQLISDQHL